MAKKNLPKIVVRKDITPLDSSEMITEAGGIVLTGDPDATAPPVSDTVLHTEAADLQTIRNKRQTTPPTATADDEIVQRDILATDYKLDAQYVEGVANKVAKAAGDVAAGEIVVLRTGFKLKKIGKTHTRHFEVFDSGPGWVHLRVKAVAKRAAYVWNYGMTDRKGNPPMKLGHAVISLEAKILITNLQSGAVYGFQYGTVLPAHDPAYSDGTEPVTYSDFIYFVAP